MFRLNGDFPEIDGQDQRDDSQNEEELFPGEIIHAEGYENGDGKDGETGRRVMKSNSLPPIFMIIGLCDDRKDGWNVSACGSAEKKKEDVKTEIALCPLEPKEDEKNTHKPDDDRFLKSPGRSQSIRD
jgi:hypothetical protein